MTPANSKDPMLYRRHNIIRYQGKRYIILDCDLKHRHYILGKWGWPVNKKEYKKRKPELHKKQISAIIHEDNLKIDMVILNPRLRYADPLRIHRVKGYRWPEDSNQDRGYYAV